MCQGNRGYAMVGMWFPLSTPSMEQWYGLTSCENQYMEPAVAEAVSGSEGRPKAMSDSVSPQSRQGAKAKMMVVET